MVAEGVNGNGKIFKMEFQSMGQVSTDQVHVKRAVLLSLVLHLPQD